MDVNGGGVSSSSTMTTWLTAAGTHVLDIRGYSAQSSNFLPGVLAGASRVFKAGGHSWRILYYPNGRYKTDTHGGISLLLQLVPAGGCPGARAVNFTACFTLLPAPGSGSKPYSSTLSGSVRPGSSYGFVGPFVAKRKLHDHYLVDDGFTVQCDVQVICTRLEAAARPRRRRAAWVDRLLSWFSSSRRRATSNKARGD